MSLGQPTSRDRTGRGLWREKRRKSKAFLRLIGKGAIVVVVGATGILTWRAVSHGPPKNTSSSPETRKKVPKVKSTLPASRSSPHLGNLIR